jgi:hypothetical protein
MPKKTTLKTTVEDPLVASKSLVTTETEQVLDTVTATENINLEGGAKKTKASNKRTFKIKLNDTEFCSRITGNTPKQAASKALTLLINQKKQQGKQGKGKIVFTIKETTRGSKGKEYSYQGEKVKLKQPTTYKIKSSNGEIKEIVNKFKNVIEKYQQ